MSLFGSASNLYFNGGSATKAYLNGTQVWTAGAPTASGAPYEFLNTIATTLRANITSLRTPRFFVYRLDGNAFQNQARASNDIPLELTCAKSYAAPRYCNISRILIGAVLSPLLLLLPFSGGRKM